ncbi:MAG: hypothetical protein IPL49_22030 [Saprospirales bacterium]|nr:hypothetical protein [Saprospirales bacterium]
MKIKFILSFAFMFSLLAYQPVFSQGEPVNKQPQTEKVDKNARRKVREQSREQVEAERQSTQEKAQEIRTKEQQEYKRTS